MQDFLVNLWNDHSQAVLDISYSAFLAIVILIACSIIASNSAPCSQSAPPALHAPGSFRPLFTAFTGEVILHCPVCELVASRDEECRLHRQCRCCYPRLR